MNNSPKLPFKSKGMVSLFFVFLLVVFGVSISFKNSELFSDLFTSAFGMSRNNTGSVKGVTIGQKEADQTEPGSGGSVLAVEDEVTENSLIFRLPVYFFDVVHGATGKFDDLLEVGTDLSVRNDVVIGNDLEVGGILISEAGVTAPNVLYSVSVGEGLTVEGTQDITLANSDPGSAQNIFKNFKFDSKTINADDNDDTLTFVSGEGIALSADGKIVTVTAISDELNVSGWNNSGTNVYLSTSTYNVGIGTSSPGYKLHVVGSSYFTGNATFAGGTVVSSGINNSIGGITNAGSITGATGLTSSGTVTFSNLSTGILHSNVNGVVSSSAINLSGGTNEVSGSLAVTNGGTGLSSATTGQIIYASAANTFSALGIGSEGEVLTVSSGVPAWGVVSGGGGEPCATCIVNNPGSTQSISPAAATATGLVVKQALSGTVDVFRVESNDGSNTFFKIDSSGNVTLGSQTSSGVFTVSPASTDPISISPVTQGVGQYTGIITSSDLTQARTWTFPDASGIICLANGNCSGTAAAVGGSGTTNYLTKWSDTYSVDNSIVYDNGTNVGIGSTSPVAKLDLVGTLKVSALATLSDDLQVNKHATISGSLRVDQSVDFNSTFGVSSATTLGSTLDVTGKGTFGGNVGIGSTSPSQALDISGSIRLGAAGANNILGTSSAGGSPTGNVYWGDRSICDSSGNCSGTSAAVGGSGTSNYLSKWSSSYGLTNSILFDNGTNIGIGTVSPIGIFNVTGASTGKALVILNETGNQNIFSASASGVTKFTVSNEGTLDIEKTITTDNTELVFEQTGDFWGASRLRLQNRDGVNGAIFENPTLDLVDFIFKPSSNASQNIRYEHRSGNVLSGNTAGEFQIGPGGSANFMVGASTAYLKATNVGIGTSNPGAGLHIETNGFKQSSNGEFTVDAVGVAGGRFKILSNGNVGIGTASPGSKLAVSSSTASDTLATIYGSDSGYAAGFTLQSGSAGANWKILSQQTYLNNALLFGTGAPYSMALTTGGNLGIGTTAPAQALDVAGNIGVGVYPGGEIYHNGDTDTKLDFGNNKLRLQAGGTPGIQLQATIFSGNWANQTNMDFSWDGDTNDGVLFVDSSAENVGIGTISPSSKLQVVGDSGINITDSYNNTGNIHLTSYGVGSGWLDFYAGGTNGDIAHFSDCCNTVFSISETNGESSFNYDLSVGGDFTVDTNTLFVDSTANNVGIGTTSPGYKFDVDGTIGFTGSLISRDDTDTKIVTSADQWEIQAGGLRFLTFDEGSNDKLTGNLNRADIDFIWNGDTNYNLLYLDAGSETVGIGTSTPVGKFDVQGAVTGKALTILNETGNQNILSASASGTTVFNLDRSGNITWNANGCSNQNCITPSARHTFYNYDIYAHNGGNIALNADGHVLLSPGGNVGVGTTSPAAKLEVQGTLEVNDRLTITDAADSGGNIRFSAANPYIYASGYTNFPGGIYVSGGTLYAQNLANFRAGINNDTATYLTISGGTSAISYFTGNIGIGSTAPGNLLDLNTTSITSGIELDNKLAISGYSGDAWLRLNNSSEFTNGIYTPSHFRSDGEIRNGSSDYGDYGIQTSGNAYINGSITAAVFNLDAAGYFQLQSGNPILAFDSNDFFQYARSTNRLSVTINAVAKSYVDTGVSGWTNYSDRRLKKDITTLDDSTLERVLSLNPVTFNWIDERRGTREELGFIAQEVEAVGLGHVVAQPSDENDYYGITYSQFAPYLVKAIQQQNKLITNLDLKISKSGELTTATTSAQIAIQPSLTIQDILSGNVSISNTVWTFIKEVVFSAKTKFLASVEFVKEVTFNGSVRFSKQNAGTVTITDGATKVKVFFDKSFSQIPNIYITNKNIFEGSISVTEVAHDYFVLELSSANSADIQVQWLAILAEETNSERVEVLESEETVVQPEIIQIIDESNIDPIEEIIIELPILETTSAAEVDEIVVDATASAEVNN